MTNVNMYNIIPAKYFKDYTPTDLTFEDMILLLDSHDSPVGKDIIVLCEYQKPLGIRYEGEVYNFLSSFSNESICSMISGDSNWFMLENKKTVGMDTNMLQRYVEKKESYSISASVGLNLIVNRMRSQEKDVSIFKTEDGKLVTTLCVPSEIYVEQNSI